MVRLNKDWKTIKPELESSVDILDRAWCEAELSSFFVKKMRDFITMIDSHEKALQMCEEDLNAIAQFCEIVFADDDSNKLHKNVKTR